MRFACLALAIVMTSVNAHANDEAPERAEAAKNAPGLSAAMKDAKVTLAAGIESSEKEGKPISAKFEVEEGSLQLSVYVMKGEQFSEVIVDHMTGAVAKTEPITGGEDLTAAKKQAAAMKKGKLSLRAAVANAEEAHTGYTAVSVTPEIEKGVAKADVALIKGTESKLIEEKL